jgi:tRNA pseudouridine55 synthase
MAKKVIPLSELPVIDKNSPFPENPDTFQNGSVILMDKPTDWSSFQLVKYVRNRIPPKKVGHAGTLDPLATGLLILCTGRATKSISQVQELDKTYHAVIRFGYSTPSFDEATDPDEYADWKHITREKLEKTLKNTFSGVISQAPPIYSAVKVKGKRLYKLARKGIDVKPEPRNVTIHEIHLLKFDLPEVELEIRCGKGTYIRSIAHELGIALGSRGVLAGLRRTATGTFRAGDAFLPEEFDTFMANRNNQS